MCMCICIYVCVCTYLCVCIRVYVSDPCSAILLCNLEIQVCSFPILLLSTAGRKQKSLLPKTELVKQHSFERTLIFPHFLNCGQIHITYKLLSLQILTVQFRVLNA